MSNRIVKHSSRYKGPMGDSRPPEEIFAGIEARIKQAEPFQARLLAAMDDIMANMTMTSWEGRAEMVRKITIDWLFANHPDFMGKRGPHEAGEADHAE